MVIIELLNGFNRNEYIDGNMNTLQKSRSCILILSFMLTIS